MIIELIALAWLQVPAAQSPAPAAQGPPVQMSVTVTAEEARRIRAATRAIEDHGDPFLVFLAGHLIDLSSALVTQDKAFTVGPLTGRELGILDLSGYLSAHHRPEGLIRIQVRRTWTDTDPAVNRFTEAGFHAMLASIAKGPFVQVPDEQRERLLWLGRAILDLNWQAGGIIADKDVFAALSRGFKDKTAGSRLVGIIRSMADSGQRYDLVPHSRLQEFHHRAEPGFLIQTPSSQPGTIKLKYGESPYATRVDHLIWSFLRMFAGDNSGDWAERESARARAVLARAVLDYLEAQVRMDATDEMWSRLAVLPANLEEIPIGTYRTLGPVITLLKDAPGVVRKSVPKEPELTAVLVRAKKVPDLRRWLDEQTVAWQAVLER